jgi:3-hydroxy acid dehydrogenase/malonic semialdehyde reductase
MNHENQGVTVVSGASSGIGERTALLLAAQGHRVVALARRGHRLATMTSTHPGLPIYPLVADVRDITLLRAAFDTLPTDYRDIGTVINNAGLSKGFGPAQEGDPRLWQEMIDTNVVGLLNVTHLMLPRLIARGRGHIINVGSVAAHYPYMGSNVYGATKAFVHQLTLNMRADVDGTGVRLSCVAPGMTRTEFALVRYEGDADRAAQLYQNVTPLSADDVAETVLWCMSRPSHVNVNMIEIMPTDQPFGLALGRPPRATPDASAATADLDSVIR